MKGMDLIKGSGRLILLQTLLKYPNREFTIRELSLLTKVPYGTTWYALNDWWQARLVEFGRVGKARTVKLKNAGYAKKMMGILEFPSPQVAAIGKIRLKFSKIKEIKAAYIFGSVAKGLEKPASDIDVALLVSKEIGLAGVLSLFYDKYGVTVAPLQFSDKKEFDDFLKDKEKVKI